MWLLIFAIVCCVTGSSVHEKELFISTPKILPRTPFQLKSYLTVVLLNNFPKERRVETIFKQYISLSDPFVVTSHPLTWEKLGKLHFLIIETPYDQPLVNIRGSINDLI